MSTSFEMDCGGEAVTLEKTDDGNIIFHGWDEETELAAIELGFEPSACWIVWNAINNDLLNEELFEKGRHGNLLLVEALLFVGASANEDHGSWGTLLHVAAEYGHVDVVKILLEAGASVDAIDPEDWTPLHIAARNGYLNIVWDLLDAGASVYAETEHKWTPLHHAAARGHEDVVEDLLKAGASVDSKTSNGFTPLDWALDYKRTAVVKFIEDWIEEHGS